MNETEMKALVEGILTKMNASYSSVDVRTDDGRVRVCVESDDSRFLIGGGGQNLQALNHIVKRIAEQKGASTPFSVDVNNYQEDALENIKSRALIIAERVRSYKTNITLDPMSSYERMVVHSILAEQPDVATESTGQGRERRVVVKYTPKEEVF